MLQSLQSQIVLNNKIHQFSNSDRNKHDICIVSSQRSSESLLLLVCLSFSVASFRSTTRLRMLWGCCKGPLTLKNLCSRNDPSGTPQNIPTTSSNDCPEHTRNNQSKHCGRAMSFKFSSKIPCRMTQQNKELHVINTAGEHDP